MKAMSNLSFLGNKELWSLPKTVFLSSDKFSAGSVLKSYDWAAEMNKQGRCVISGFLSKLEKDVCAILMRGSSPVIYALARSMYEKPPAKLKPYIDAGRLLVVSQFGPGIVRYTRDLALLRNKFIIDIADEIVFAHVHSGGMLDELRLREGLSLRVLDEE